MNRREMLKLTGSTIAGTSLLGIQALAAGDTPDKIMATATIVKKKILVIGAHPDDPETACGGTMLLLKQAGHEVVSVYMTRGQGGIVGKSHDEAAAIRTKEAEEACRILKAQPVFMTQVDGNTEINKQRYAEMRELIASEKPDVVFTHWPIDSHPDHRVCSLLVYDAWRRLDYNFELFYFEVMSGMQTQLFNPTDYVDISAVVEQKRKACHCHVSQDMPSLYDGWHDRMERFRGLEAHCAYAESFIHLRRINSDISPLL